MAEIQQQDSRNKRGGIRSKKLSTRVDLTPMVDLGFLLITFFIFTTSMSESRGLKLIVPDDHPVEPPIHIPESKTISLILKEGDVIQYYNGLQNNQVRTTNYSASGLRMVIQEKMKEVMLKYGNSSETIVLIKPTSEANYKNIVTVLDEMLINNVKRYVLMEPSELERKL